MRRHSSILMLYARSTLGKVGMMILLLAVVQSLLFWGSMERNWDNAIETAAYAEERNKELGESRSTNPANYMECVDGIWDVSLSSVLFAVAVIALTVMLTATGWERKEKVSYTLNRLSVSGGEIFLWNGLYNTVCFFLLWSAEVFIILGLGLWYMKWVGDETGPHTMFLAFYRSRFFHNLFPLEDVGCWIRNGILCISLGFSSAASTCVQRRDGKMGGAVIPVVGVAFLAFLQEESIFANYLLIMVCCVFLLGVVFNSVFLKEEA